MFQVLFYETADGFRPVEAFLDSLAPKMRAKLVAMMMLLAEKGPSLRLPYTAPLGDGLFELRVIHGNDIVRALFFFCAEKRIIITNAFVKKQQKTPRREINLAKARRNDYYQREGAKK